MNTSRLQFIKTVAVIQTVFTNHILSGKFIAKTNNVNCAKPLTMQVVLYRTLPRSTNG